MRINKKRKLVAGVVLIQIEIERKKLRKERKCWSKNWWLQRQTKQSYLPFLRELANNEPGDFLRMSPESFEKLLSMVEPFIKKQDTVMRSAISPKERLITTLLQLATGYTYEELKFPTAISPQALGKIIPETCWAIYHSLKPEYMKMPSSPEEWETVAQDFTTECNFPHCIGTMNGKQIRIKCPAHSGSVYLNYKGFYSIVLIGLVNASCEFIMCDVGANEQISDGGIFYHSHFGTKLIESALNLPKPRPISDSESIQPMPFVIVGDDAFALNDSTNMTCPYPVNNLTHDQHIFNYRHSRARSPGENCIGILFDKFRILQNTIQVEPEKVKPMVLACCSLHNFLHRECPEVYTPPGSLDSEIDGQISEGSWRQNTNLVNNLLNTSQHRNFSNTFKEIRDEFTRYFCNEGAVDRQGLTKTDSSSYTW